MSTMPIPNQTENSILYDLYQNVPIGVVLLDSHMKVLSANRRFRTYFPFYPEGPEGLSLCNAIGCRYTEEKIYGDGPKGCESCPVLRSVGSMIRDNVPMEEIQIGHNPPDQYHRGTQWFRVNGIPADCSYGRYGILFFDDVTAQMKKEKALKKKLELDLPTNVLNKYGLMKYLDSLLQAEKAEPVVACMIDFDDFKKINDQYGHLMGDKVLNRFSEIARKSIRADDALGRYGGEEFLFVFRGAGRGQARNIVGRIQAELRESFRGVLSLPVTFSAGMICMDAGSPFPRWNDLIETLDRLLYRAKAEGKNRIVADG